MNTYNKVTFDETHFNAFVKLALDEKLLFIDKKKNDNYNPFENIKVQKEVQVRVLEQITLTPNIITTRTMFKNDYQALSGKLMDEGRIQYVEKVELNNDDHSEFIKTNTTEQIIQSFNDSFPLPIILGIINAKRNEKLDIVQLHNIMKQGYDAQKEQYEFELRTGKKPPKIDKFSHDLNEIMNKAGLGVPDLLANYSEEEIEAQKRRGKIFGLVNPIIDGFNEFTEITMLANRENAMAKFDAPKDVIWKIEGDINYTNKDIALFRIVADGLDRKTFKSTLNSTLELSKDEATQALRVHLTELVKHIENLNENEIRSINEEIKKALAIVSGSRNFDKDAKYCGTIGISTNAMNLLLVKLGILNPVVGTMVAIGGLTIGFMGIINRGTGEKIRDSYRWALFDNR